MDDLESLIAEIDSISPLDDAEELDNLDRVLVAIFSLPNHDRAIDALFHLLERFPEEDSYGIFWSVLHDLEHIPGYESKLLASIHRQPSEFSLMMINRMMNAGMMRIDETELLGLLESIADDSSQSLRIRRWAEGYAEWQRKRGLRQR